MLNVLTMDGSIKCEGDVGPQGVQGEQGIQGVQGIQGIQGADGVGITSIAKTGTSGLVDTYTITLTNGNSSTFTVTNGEKGETGDEGPQGPEGPQGADGTNGTNGQDGADGVGIVSIARTSGTGAPGTTDTYTITLSNNNTFTFTVYNGANGTTPTIDTTLNGSSQNAIANSAVVGGLDGKQTKMATDLTADLYFTDGTAPTLADGLYYSNGHKIYINNVRQQIPTNGIFNCFHEIIDEGEPNEQTWYYIYEVTVNGTVYFASYDTDSQQWGYSNSPIITRKYIDTTMPSNAQDYRVPSTKLLKTQLGNKENTSNKVTIISSSSTDTQYPSAKAVYDYIDTMITQAIGGSY